MPETTTSVFRHTRKNPVYVPETTRKTVVSGIGRRNPVNRPIVPPKALSKEKACFGPRSREIGEKISRFVEAHRALLQFSRFSFNCASGLRNPYFYYFYSVFGTSPSAIVEKCTFLKTSKPGTEKLSFRHICLVFLGRETPICVVFSRPPKGGVQLSSLQVTKMGFD